MTGERGRGILQMGYLFAILLYGFPRRLVNNLGAGLPTGQPGALRPFPRPAAMITRVRDDVRDPPEQATRADPEARRNDEPQDTGQEPTVVELSDSGDDRT